MIDSRDVRRALDSMKPEACKHPPDQIRDLPDRSYCKKCQQDVPPLMRKSGGQTLETKQNKEDDPPTRMGIFPSAKSMDWMGRIRHND